MSSVNQVVSRLQNQRSRIQGMLSPGKKHQPGLSFNASLSPVAPDFAGRKFQLAARKMRILDPEKVGAIQSGGLTLLSSTIQNKFAEIQKIIHINPGAAREKSIWSSVETPLPESQAAVQETPQEPGVMRSGSIIQKMSTVPKPGQSLNSFKEQIQAQPRTTRSTLEKKPVIGKNTRRFSQVQEVTPGQKPTPPEIPAVPVKPDEPQARLDLAKNAPEPAILQSQPDLSVSVTEKPVIASRAETLFSKPSESPVKKVLPPEMPLRAKPRPSETEIPAEQHTLPVAKLQSEVAGGKESQADQPHKAPIHLQEKDLLKALPVVKKGPVQDEVKKALPVKKEQKQPQKPVARSTIQRRADAPTESVRPTIQREPEADLSSSAPVRPVMQETAETELPVATPVRPVTQQPTEPGLSAVPPVRSAQDKPQKTDPSPTVLPASSQTDLNTPDMPLQQKLDYRKNASRGLRAIAPDQMKPVYQESLIHREDAPLLTRSKYSPASTQASLPELSLKRDPSPLSKQVQQSVPFRAPDALQMDLPRRLAPPAPAPEHVLPIPMPLAPQITAPAAVKPASKPEPATTPIQPSFIQPPRKTTGLSKTNNTIQRTWEGHTPPSQKSSEKPAGDAGTSGSTDLQELAENVFPYVKRILEIETGRSSGKLR